MALSGMTPVEQHACSGMPAVPPLSAVTALIGIDPDDPTDTEDYAVLRGLLARRVAPVDKPASNRLGLDAHRRGAQTCTLCSISNPGAAW